jgi:hypothetical protein
MTKDDHSLWIAAVVVGVLLGLLTMSQWGRVFLLTAGAASVAAITFHYDRHLLALCSGALVVRVLIIVVDSQLGLLQHPPIMVGHNIRAIIQYNALLNGEVFVELPNQGDMRRLVALLLTPFYAVFGEWSVSGRIAIATYSLGIGVGMYGVTRTLSTHRMGLGVAGASLFWPSILYRSTVIQRETLLGAVMIAILWLAIRLVDDFRIKELLLLVPLIGAVVVFRGENLLLVVVMFGTAFLVRSGNIWRRITTVTAVTVPALSYFVLNFRQITGYRSVSPGELSDFAQQRANGTTAYLVDLTYESWFDVFIYLPIKLVYYLFMPFPWYWSSPEIVLIGVNSGLLLVATILAIQGFGRTYPSHANLVPVTFLLAGLGTYALIELNYGAAFRRRIQFTPIILMFAAFRLSNIDVTVRWSKDSESAVTATESTQTDY